MVENPALAERSVSFQSHFAGHVIATYVLKMGGCQSSSMSTSDSAEKKLVSFSSKLQMDGFFRNVQVKGRKRCNLGVYVYLIQWSFGCHLEKTILSVQCQWTIILIVFDLQVLSMIYIYIYIDRLDLLDNMF